MGYKYKDETLVRAEIRMQEWGTRRTLEIAIKRKDEKNWTVITTKKDFEAQFRCLEELIRAGYKNKEQVWSVTSLLDQVPDIPPEASLWYAFVVHDLIRYYKSNHKYGEIRFDEALDFLAYEPSSCFQKMKSVK